MRSSETHIAVTVETMKGRVGRYQRTTGHKLRRDRRTGGWYEIEGDRLIRKYESLSEMAIQTGLLKPYEMLLQEI